MKKTIIAITVLLTAAALGLSAQEKDTTRSYDEFNGHWFIGVQGGIGQTLGETSFGTLISPAAAVSFGYQFTPVWGLRVGLSGWQAMGAAVDVSTNIYKYNYFQGNIDVMVDLCGIAGYRVSRAVNPYLFAGIGVNGAYNNREAHNVQGLPEDNLLWSGSKIFPAGRFGVGMGVRGSAVDWQLGALAGFTFKIGLKKDKEPVEEEPVLCYEDTVVAAPVAEPEDTADATAATTATVAVAPALDSAAYAVADFEAVEENIFFLIGKSEIRSSEEAKVEEIINVMSANPQTRVTVTGYADKETGSDERNMQLSKERAENVAAALIDAGIDPERITVLYKGSSETPFDSPEENRVAICVVDDDM